MAAKRVGRSYGEGQVGSGGVATAAFSSNHDFARGVAPLSDGRILVVGQSSNLVNTDFGVARFNADATPDTS